jgi:hypothetical protein
MIPQLRSMGPPSFLVRLHEKPEICIFLRKYLVRELRKTDLSRFFTQYSEPIDVSIVKILLRFTVTLYSITEYGRIAMILVSFCRAAHALSDGIFRFAIR